MWTSQGIKSCVNDLPPKALTTFDSRSGPTPRTKREKSPLQVFSLFFTVALLQMIVIQSNGYASEKGDSLDLTIEELQAFLGINLAMGMLRLPQVRDYWAHDEIFSTPWFPSIMARDRFFKIMRYIHVVDNSLQKKKGEDGYDPLFKVRPLTDHLSAVFPQYYHPGRHLSIDEMMIGTRCKISFLQYLPKKPTKFGIKVFVNSESKSGYVLTFQIYTGKSTKKKEESEGSQSISNPVSYDVVFDLLEPYLGKGHWVFMDNYYSSPKLFKDLLERQTFATGTLRQNRKSFPDVLKSKNNKLEVGNYHFATSGDLLAVIWRDRRDVHLLSTAHNQSVVSVMKRPKGSRKKVPTSCPRCVVDYNMYMGGVDLTDQYLSYYSLTRRRTIKWWKKVFWRMVDISVLNSWIIYHANFPEDEINSHRLFRTKLIHELVQPLLSVKAKGKARKVTCGRLQGKHFAYKASRRARCVVCNKKTQHKRTDKKTMNYCTKCSVHLCVGACFEKYHTLSEL